MIVFHCVSEQQEVEAPDDIEEFSDDSEKSSDDSEESNLNGKNSGNHYIQCILTCNTSIEYFCTREYITNPTS